jgi:hypothetical protein
MFEVLLTFSLPLFSITDKFTLNLRPGFLLKASTGNSRLGRRKES